MLKSSILGQNLDFLNLLSGLPSSLGDLKVEKLKKGGHGS